MKSSMAAVCWGQRLIGEGAVVEGARVVRIEVDGGVEIRKRELELVVLAVDIAAPDIGDGVVRIDLDRLVVVGEREVVVLQPALDERPVGIGLVEGGIDLDRLVEVGDRLAQLVGAAVGGAADVVGVGVGGVQFDGGGKRADIGLGRHRGVGVILALAEIARGLRLASGEEKRSEEGERAPVPGQESPSLCPRSIPPSRRLPVPNRIDLASTPKTRLADCTASAKDLNPAN